jgi:predicted permease
MDNLYQDLVYALRRLGRSPGFALVAMATLAIGIGANSAIFSVINAVLLRPLPYDQPDRLVRVSQTWEGRPVVYSPENFLDVEAQAQSFESMAAVDEGGLTVTGQGAPVRVEGAGVSASFFDVLRVRPPQGRGFRPGENEPGKTKVVVLGHRLWSQWFGGDPRAIGRSIQLNREPYLIVGVAPAGFSYPEGAEVWTPLEYDAQLRTKSRGAWYLGVIGRLKPRISVEHAREEVATIAARLARQYPDMNEKVGGTVASLQEALVGDARPALLVLLGAVGLVLLIACVNVANLLLARVAAREGELAVRTALGAGRGRLLQQLMTESVTLAVLGGAAGVFLAWLCLDTLLGLQPAGVPRLAEVGIDRTVLAFAFALSVLTGILFGVFPALQMMRRATAQSLREGSRGLLNRRGGGLGGGLVVGQMALAMMLLAGAGLLMRSFTQLRHVEPGFEAANALTFRIGLPETAYAEEAGRAAFFDALLTRLQALPGVRSAGAVSGLPLSGMRFSLVFEVVGRPPLPPAQQPSMELRVVTADYFRTLGIPLLRGRAFARSDTSDSPQVVLLSQSAARRFFPDEDPLGHRINLGYRRGEGRPPAGGEVIGIVGDVRDRGLAKEQPPEVYLPYPQLPFQTMDVALRTAVSPMSVASSMEKAVHELDPELPVARTQALDRIVARSISEPRFYMLLIGVFAAMALLLAALGIFGVMSYAVVRRSREIGIRVALGAHRVDVLRIVLGRAVVLVAAGVGVGLVGTLALSRTMASLLFNLSPTDPTTLVGVATLLAAVALLASYLPARKATRVDPLVALRSE